MRMMRRRILGKDSVLISKGTVNYAEQNRQMRRYYGAPSPVISSLFIEIVPAYRTSNSQFILFSAHVWGLVTLDESTVCERISKRAMREEPPPKLLKVLSSISFALRTLFNQRSRV